MDMTIIGAAGHALTTMLEPMRFLFLIGGVILGIIIGILPGIGGLAGTALLLPFTYSMDSYTAIAFLLGLGAATATGDPIPAILFGVPGGVGSAATVQDGFAMAKKGFAGRALAASYVSSLMGGVFGACLLAIAIPVLRPFMLFIGSPELLAFGVFGLSMVAMLSGKAPLRGLTAAGIGVMLSMIGASPQTGTMRWTLDTLYLWEGIPLVPLTLGLFALPELCDLAITRNSIAAGGVGGVGSGMLAGARDSIRHWWLVLRCSWIGAGFATVPGIGAAIIDWIAYAHALRTERGARQSFGTGDVRGVIAAESANNAREGGALVPTIAFGVPSSSGMAVLLGAFLIHGIVPGPDMLTKHLDITYAMVWSVALANIAGAGLCFLFSAQFAKLATLRYTLILPGILSIIYIGAYEGSRNWGDLYVLLLFGVVGWIMKQLRWPRPPLILGFVLGASIESNLFISLRVYGADWIYRPVVIILFAFALLSLLRPIIAGYRNGSMRFSGGGLAKLKIGPADIFYVAVVCLLGAMIFEALSWPFDAKIVPMIVGVAALVFVLISLVNQVYVHVKVPSNDPLKAAEEEEDDQIHMDLGSDMGDLPTSTVLKRAAVFFAWIVAFMGSMAVIGLVPTVPLFVIAYMWFEQRERWLLMLAYAAAIALFVYVVFDRLLSIPWPPTLLGTWFPALHAVIPSM
ncbi:tripartite tricarboxylate transporter permease [Rhizobium binxianense]